MISNLARTFDPRYYCKVRTRMTYCSLRNMFRKSFWNRCFISLLTVILVLRKAYKYWEQSYVSPEQLANGTCSDESCATIYNLPEKDVLIKQKHFITVPVSNPIISVMPHLEYRDLYLITECFRRVRWTFVQCFNGLGVILIVAGLTRSSSRFLIWTPTPINPVSNSSIWLSLRSGLFGNPGCVTTSTQ